MILSCYLMNLLVDVSILSITVCLMENYLVLNAIIRFIVVFPSQLNLSLWILRYIDTINQLVTQLDVKFSHLFLHFGMFWYNKSMFRQYIFQQV